MVGGKANIVAACRKAVKSRGRLQGSWVTK